ncbi:unnamed protein product [Amoebophrya sp. A120]|nr:unnamed protein product [Amoebophrya sp. A120]|eukprot:GSA120T00016945001.1
MKKAAQQGWNYTVHFFSLLAQCSNYNPRTKKTSWCGVDICIPSRGWKWNLNFEVCLSEVSNGVQHRLMLCMAPVLSVSHSFSGGTIFHLSPASITFTCVKTNVQQR